MSCYDRRDWADFVDSGYPDLKGHEAEVYGLWRYEIRQVALPARARRALEGWRRAPGARLSIWIFVLGHELTQAEQNDVYKRTAEPAIRRGEGRLWRLPEVRRLRHALGIKRHMQPPPRGFASCPLKRAVGGRL